MYNFKSLSLIALVAAPSMYAFAPSPPSQVANKLFERTDQTIHPFLVHSVTHRQPLHLSMQNQETETETDTETNVESPVEHSKPEKKASKPPHGKQGVFSPVVLTVKSLMDESNFNQLRAKAISLHSNVIEGFVVKNSETPLGQTVLKRLFTLVDQNHNGVVEQEELQIALQRLGFEWLQEKQVQGILTRADKNHNGQLELDEFLAEAPKTLRTNLIKLAKKNGGELGLLV